MVFIFFGSFYVCMDQIADPPTQVIPKTQPGVFCKLIYPVMYPKAKKVVSKLIFRWHLFGFDITSEKKLVVEKGQFIIILYWAYLLNFLLNFLKLVLLFKSDPMVKSARLCSKLFRNENLGKMAIFRVFHIKVNIRKRHIFVSRKERVILKTVSKRSFTPILLCEISQVSLK